MSQFDYKPSTDFEWLDNSYVKVEQKNKQLTTITGNKEGLLSLARQLEAFALREDPSVCYEPWPGDLEEGSVTLEIIKNGLQRKTSGTRSVSCSLIYTKMITINGKKETEA